MFRVIVEHFSSKVDELIMGNLQDKCPTSPMAYRQETGNANGGFPIISSRRKPEHARQGVLDQNLKYAPVCTVE